MSDAFQMTEALAGRLTGAQALVAIFTLPFLLGLFLAAWAMRKKLGLESEAAEPAGTKDIVDRTNALLDNLQEELRHSQALLQRYVVELDQLRTARLSLLMRSQQFLDAAVAGRTMVHELQRRMGVAETEFLPLPSLAELSVTVSAGN